MLCADATRIERLKYAVSSSSCSTSANWRFVVDRLMLITSKPCSTAQRRPARRIGPDPVKPAPSTRTLTSSQSGARPRMIPAQPVPCPHESPSSSGPTTGSPSSPIETATASEIGPTFGWSGWTPLSRTQTRTSLPVAPSSAHSRVTRSGHSKVSRMRSIASAGSDHAGSGRSSASATAVLPSLLGFLEPLRHRLQHLPGDRRVRLDERAEVPERHPVAAQVGLGGNRGGAIDVGDQNDLAEVVAWAEGSHLFAADAHLRRAVVDHEETDAALAFFGHGVAGVERPLLHRPGDLLQLTVVEIGEDGDALDQFHGCSGHAGEHKATAWATIRG